MFICRRGVSLTSQRAWFSEHVLLATPRIMNSARQLALCNVSRDPAPSEHHEGLSCTLAEA